jgi:hypothetical protein
LLVYTFLRAQAESTLVLLPSEARTPKSSSEELRSLNEPPLAGLRGTGFWHRVTKPERVRVAMLL